MIGHVAGVRKSFMQSFGRARLLSAIDTRVISLDEVYFLARLKAKAGKKQLFHEGWGDDSLLEVVRELWTSTDSPEMPLMAWDGDWTVKKGLMERCGSFGGTVYAPWLPEECQRAGFKLIVPEKCDGRRAVVLAPTSREIGFSRRTKIATELAELGVCVMLLDNPWMGDRKPARQFETVVSTFCEYPLMSATCVEENRMAMTWLHSEGFRQICVAGVSQGGFTGIAAALRMPFKVGVVAVAAPHSAEPVVIEGIPGRICAWDALEASCPKGGDARSAMRDIFESTRLDTMGVTSAAPAMHLFQARSDRYVSAYSYELMAKRFRDRSKIEWSAGGHVSTILERSRYEGAVLDVLESLSGSERTKA